MNQQWTEERKQKQAATIKETQPWKKSTGPKTAAGKAVVSQNATKHGLRGGIFRQAANLFAKQNKLLKELADGN